MFKACYSRKTNPLLLDDDHFFWFGLSLYLLILFMILIELLVFNRK